MDEYTLMELSWRKGVKNVICHLLAPRKTISLIEVEETRRYSYLQELVFGTR